MIAAAIVDDAAVDAGWIRYPQLARDTRVALVAAATVAE